MPPGAKPFANDRYKPVTREDVTDLALLPRRFDVFVAEMRALITDRVLPMLERIDARLTDHGERITQLERDQSRTDKRLAALEAKRKARK